MPLIGDVIRAAAMDLAGARRVLAITGAGVSADSGLPTYRGIGGLYDDAATEDGYAIEQALSGHMMRVRPEVCWKYIHQIESSCRGARHNAAHEALAQMEQRFEHFTLLTQNIDGFHRAAGSRNLIEIHGNVQQLYCTACADERSVNSYAGLAIPPACVRCGALVRPRVVLFGERLPEGELGRLYAALYRGVDAVLTIGTTSVFPYIAEPVVRAARAGVPTIEINPGETEVSRFVRHRIRERAAVVLPQIMALLAAASRS
ncbi:MAG TPA: NAD-dependent protein deacylase [Nevskiaceae bacterium]|nr:NAD-dependent protein deacylase [Nevskiaceae bacterium]